MSLDVQRISLDISKQPTPQQVRLGQGDANATQLIVDVFDDGVAYDLSSYSVRLLMRLPNDGGYYDVDGTKSGNTATFEVDETYAASVHGFDGYGYIDVMSGDTVICSTSRFQLVVLRSASDGVEVSQQYSDAINDAIARADAAAEAAEGVILQDVPLMTAYVRGGAQLGSGLEITDGVLSVDNSAIQIPTMGASVKGGAKLGSGLEVTSDVLSVNITPSDIGAAAASHTHAAADVTSGQITIANGGTAASTAADARTNLGITPSNIGALPTSGGTVTGTLNLTGGVQVASRASYPLYVYSSKPAQASLPSTPCFVLDTSDGGFYYNDGS